MRFWHRDTTWDFARFILTWSTIPSSWARCDDCSTRTMRNPLFLSLISNEAQVENIFAKSDFHCILFMAAIYQTRWHVPQDANASELHQETRDIRRACGCIPLLMILLIKSYLNPSLLADAPSSSLLSFPLSLCNGRAGDWKVLPTHRGATARFSLLCFSLSNLIDAEIF